MEAAAHNSSFAHKVHVPQHVAKEFVKADEMRERLVGKKMGSKAPSPMPKGYGR